MHLADTFIQSDLQLHSGYTFSLVHVFPGNRTHKPFAQLTQCSTTELHRNTVVALLFVLIASINVLICKSLWIKASAKLLKNK